MSYQPPTNYDPQDPQGQGSSSYGSQSQYPPETAGYPPTLPSSNLYSANAYPPPPPPPSTGGSQYAMYAGGPAGYAMPGIPLEHKKASPLGLILGIISLLLVLSLFTGNGTVLLICLAIGMILSIVGLIISIRARRTSTIGRGVATAGLTLSIIALAIWLILLVIIIIAAISIAGHPVPY
ncbi:MAG TPA: DUF4190 domain-containing protein [Ktedonobacteraceae bacterium]|nr:DUF4190 domain-containing protein [Ktedonobacteraceae bacterium]